MEENKAAGGGGVANAPGEQRLTVQKVAQAERNAKHVKLKIGTYISSSWLLSSL